MKTAIRATRYHDISCGHRVAGHESKCAFLHGHNYRIHFTCEGESLDEIGRVLDFSAMKSKLCTWLEDNWDHKFLAWEDDPALQELRKLVVDHSMEDHSTHSVTLLGTSIVWVPFNPTAENIADHLLRTICPWALKGTSVRVIKVVVDETRKCSASAEVA